MIYDTVQIDAYHEARLALKLGYMLFCELKGQPAPLSVRDIRLLDEHRCIKYRELFVPAAVHDEQLEIHMATYGFPPRVVDNLEVLVAEGWRQPIRCWATNQKQPELLPTLEPPAQKGLFE